MSVTRFFTAASAAAVPLRAFTLVSRQSSADSSVVVPCARALRATSAAAPWSNENKMYIAEERGSLYAPDYRVYFSELTFTCLCLLAYYLIIYDYIPIISVMTLALDTRWVPRVRAISSSARPWPFDCRGATTHLPTYCPADSRYLFKLIWKANVSFNQNYLAPILYYLPYLKIISKFSCRYLFRSKNHLLS